MQDRGYIALHRQVFGHPLFKGEKPFTRLHAWLWLIAHAAWCPTQRRVGRKVVTLDRGQTATTVRELAKTWGWHRSKVERFLRMLRLEAMIRTRAGETIAETTGETTSRTRITIITICNYSKFNDPSTGQDSAPRQEPRRKPRRGEQQAFDLGDEIAPQPSNQSTKDSKRVLGGVEKGTKSADRKSKPRHGQVSKTKGVTWFDVGTEEYRLYADDFRSVTGTEPIPKSYPDGKGRWFKTLGEGHGKMARSIEGRMAEATIIAQRRRTA